MATFHVPCNYGLCRRHEVAVGVKTILLKVSLQKNLKLHINNLTVGEPLYDLFSIFKDIEFSSLR